MKRTHAPHWSVLLAALLVAVCIAAPGTAAADATTTTSVGSPLTITLLRIGDKTYNAVAKRPINKAECDEDGLELTFRVEGLGAVANPEFLEVWLGTECDQTTRNDPDSAKKCTVLASKSVNDTDKTLSAFKVPVATLCKTTEGMPTLFFLGVKTKKGNDEPTYSGKIDVSVDRTAPSAPTKVNGGSGETEIPVKWNNPSDEIDHCLLIWDDAASSAPSSKDAGAAEDDGGVLLPGPSDCSSSILKGGSHLGSDLSKLPDGLSGKTVDGNVESATLDGTNLGSKVAAVAVIAVDKAGNASAVSNVSCIEVVPTTGFWDQYQKDPDAVEEGCACTAPGHGAHDSARGAGWPLGLAAVALLLRARRRRS